MSSLIKKYTKQSIGEIWTFSWLYSNLLISIEDQDNNYYNIVDNFEQNDKKTNYSTFGEILPDRAIKKHDRKMRANGPSVSSARGLHRFTFAIKRDRLRDGDETSPNLRDNLAKTTTVLRYERQKFGY